MAWNDTKSTGNNLTASEWNAHVTDQESRLANVLEDTTPQLGGNLDMNSKNIEGVTPTEMGYVSGVTSAIQTQIDATSPKLAVITTVSTPTYTLASTDSDSILSVDTTATVTLPDSLSTGFQVVIINGSSATTDDVTLAASTTLQSKDSAVILDNQYGAATAVHKGSNVWYAFGDLS